MVNIVKFVGVKSYGRKKSQINANLSVRRLRRTIKNRIDSLSESFIVRAGYKNSPSTELYAMSLDYDLWVY